MSMIYCLLLVGHNANIGCTVICKQEGAGNTGIGCTVICRQEGAGNTDLHVDLGSQPPVIKNVTFCNSILFNKRAANILFLEKLSVTC